MSEPLSHEEAKISKNNFLFFVSSCSILLLAFALRAWALDAQSLWFDEGWSWHLATMPLGEMALTTAGDRSPPLYYALLHAWIALAGESEFALRTISALADTAAVALVMAFAASLTGRRSPHAILAGLIYALAPFAVWYAQEARMYALVAALCTASSWLLWLWLRSGAGSGRPGPSTDGRGIGRTRTLVASAAVLALAIYCHYYAIFLLPGQFLAVLAVALIARRPGAAKPLLHFCLAAGGVIVVLIPWLLVASTGFAYDDGFAFPLNTIDGRLLEFARAAAGGGVREPPAWWPLALGAAGALGIAGFAAGRRWRALAVVLALILGPLLAATIAVRVVYPYRSVFHARYLIYVLPMACVLFGGAGLWLRAGPRPAVSRRAIAALLAVAPLVPLGALWLPPLLGYFTDPALARDDARGAVKHVVEALAPGDVVIMSRDNFAVRYYWPRQWRASLSADYDPAAGTLLAAPDGLHGVLAGDAGVLDKLNAAERKRTRLMLWQDDVVDPQRFVESSLWPNAYQIGEYNFGQIRLPLYQVTQFPMQRPAFAPIDAAFGDQLKLARAWQPSRATAGDWFYAVLEWQPLRALDADYKAFVHVLDAQGNLAFQSDRLPLNALLPTSRWPAGQVQRDAHAVVVPAELPAGRYRVVAGVYDPATGARLPVDGPLGDAVDLGELEVVRR